LRPQLKRHVCGVAALQAIKEGRKHFNFLGQDIRLIPSCAICVTMNPGYAGEVPSDCLHHLADDCHSL
jgi:hypothetical protein